MLLWPKRRSHPWTGSAICGPLVVGAFMLLAAAKAAQREGHIVEKVRSVCAHNGFKSDDVHRLVRLEFGMSETEEEAMHAVVAICRGVGGVAEENPSATRVAQ
jgi:hypothetical protein